MNSIFSDQFAKVVTNPLSDAGLRTLRACCAGASWSKISAGQGTMTAMGSSYLWGKSPFLMGKSTINGSFLMAMLNYQRVHSLLLEWFGDVLFPFLKMGKHTHKLLVHFFRLETRTAAWATEHTARVAVLEAALKVFHSDHPISRAPSLEPEFHTCTKGNVTLILIMDDSAHGFHVCYNYMETWIPSIYPSHVSIYTSTMDPSWVGSFAPSFRIRLWHPDDRHGRNGLDNVAMEWIASGLVDDTQPLGMVISLVISLVKHGNPLSFLKRKHNQMVRYGKYVSDIFVGIIRWYSMSLLGSNSILIVWKLAFQSYGALECHPEIGSPGQIWGQFLLPTAFYQASTQTITHSMLQLK